MASPLLREKLRRKEFFVVPGAQDMIAAKIVDKVGFDCVYGTGYWLTASAHGLPDAGLVGYGEMLERMRTLVRSTKAAVIADADTGYGGLLNVQQTVRGYEDAGVTAIQIEDQEFPKRCGHMPGKRVVPTGEMVRKVEVAVASRRDTENFLIIARTDARATEGIEAAIERLKAYERAGADILFLEAPLSEEEMERACAAVDRPMVVNMAEGGRTPILSGKRLAELGYAFAIYPSTTSLAAAAAMEHVLRALQSGGSVDASKLFDFKEFCEIIGFGEISDFERRWQ